MGLHNCARMTTATVGTGPITVGVPVTGFLSFAQAGVADGETVSYGIADGMAQEVGHGVYTAATGTLTRVVSASTNGGQPLSLSGNAQVFLTMLAEDVLMPSGNGAALTGLTQAQITGLRATDSPTFAGLTTTGVASMANSLRVTPVANAVNVMEIYGATTGSAALIQSDGADGAVPLNLLAKGASVRIGSYAGYGLTVGAPANAVNYWQMAASVSGSGQPSLVAVGADSSIAAQTIAKGGSGCHFADAPNASGPIAYFRGISNGSHLVVGNGAVANNYMQLAGAAAGGYPYAWATGSDTNVGMSVLSKGGGPLNLGTNWSVLQFQINHAANANNYWQATGSDNSFPQLSVAGATAGVGLGINDKAGYGVYAVSSGSPALCAYNPSPGAVNYWYMTGAPTTGAATLATTGNDTAVTANYSVKGATQHQFYTNGATQFVVANVNGAVNCIAVGGNVTGYGPTLCSNGSDANSYLYLVSRGSQPIFLGTGANSPQAGLAVSQFEVDHTANAVNRLSVTGGPTTSGPNFVAIGSDTAVQANYYSKGGAGHAFLGNGYGCQFFVAVANNSVNYPQVIGSASGSPVIFGAAGTDTNIPIQLIPKGSAALIVNAPISATFTAGANDVSNVTLNRNASYSGGTAGFVNSPLGINVTVGANVTAYEWATNTILTSYANAGQHVGGADRVDAYGSAPVWGRYIQFYGRNNGGTVLGMEIQGGRNVAGMAVALDITQPAGWTIDEAIRTPAGTNVSIGKNGGSYGGGTGVIYIANDTADPASNPTGGGILYVSNGSLKYRGSNGTITTLAAA